MENSYICSIIKKYYMKKKNLFSVVSYFATTGLLTMLNVKLDIPGFLIAIGIAWILNMVYDLLEE
jgi:hypothetical protein